MKQCWIQSVLGWVTACKGSAANGQSASKRHKSQGAIGDLDKAPLSGEGRKKAINDHHKTIARSL